LLKKAALTRASVAPDRSSAIIVFSKVGSSVVCVIASTSASCSAKPRANAGA
jgi:hypothetical protein